MNKEKCIILKQILISKDKHHRLGNTKHYINGKIYDKLPCELKILEYENVKGFYLIHFDEHGDEITNTFHENVQGALNQAEFEFGINENEWITLSK